MMPQSPPWSKPLHQIINALIAKELMRHPDMNVNISVACCISEILRITAPIAPYNNEQIMDFFELIVMLFKKLSSESGRYYGKTIKVLEIFCKARLPMLDLKLDGHGLIVRLFKHFLNASNFDSPAIVLNVEKIITMIIEKSEKLAIKLQALIRTSMKEDNQRASPACWKFGENVLMICAAKLKPIDRMSIAVYNYPKMVTHICETASEMIQAQSAEHGEILVGRRIKVWRAKDQIYRPGVVKSFDCIFKMHKVLFDDGFEEVVDLKWKQWTLFKNVFTVPDSHVYGRGSAYKVSSPESGIICVHGYKIKTINASILEAIFKKHGGDVGAKCVFPDAMRTYLLEAVCELARRIETNDVTNIISKMEEIHSQVSVAETPADHGSTIWRFVRCLGQITTYINQMDYKRTKEYLPRVHHSRQMDEELRESYRTLEKCLFHKGRNITPSFIAENNMLPFF
nr:phospholipase-like protein [Tanacetum cinerariifolium]